MPRAATDPQPLMSLHYFPIGGAKAQYMCLAENGSIKWQERGVCVCVSHMGADFRPILVLKLVQISIR